MELKRIAEDSARGGFSLMAGNAASTIIAAVAVIFIARLLGPEGYGIYTLAFVLPAIFVAIADFGLSPALTRYGASLRSQRKYGRLASMIGSGLLFKLVVGAAASLLALGLSRQLAASALQRQDMGGLVALASVTILFQGFFNLAYNSLVGLDRMGQGAMILVLRETTRAILSPVLIVAGFAVAGAITGQVFGWTLASLLGVWFLLTYRQGLRNVSGEIDVETGARADIGTMMRYGLPLSVGSTLSIVISQYQNIVLAFFTSNVEIGDFNAATNFGSLVGIFSIPVVTALFPAFSKLDLQDRKDELRTMFELSIRYAALFILPVTFAVAVLSKDLTRAVYGAAYSHASTYLMLYICTFLLIGLGSQIVGNFFNGIGKTTDTLKIALVYLLILLPAAPLMTSLYGVLGLIVSLILSSLVSTVFGLRVATGKYGMRIDLSGSLSVLAAALTSTLPVLPLAYYSPLPSLANVLAGALIYVAAYLTLAPVFKAIKRNDLEILATILGQIRIIRPATDLIFAYETHLLSMLERHIGAYSTSRKPQ